MGKQAIESYTQQGLDPHDVGEAAYRLLINPKPPLRNLIMSDSQFGPDHSLDVQVSLLMHKDSPCAS